MAKHMIFNYRYKNTRYLFAWSPFNKKYPHEKHRLTETVIVISKATRVMKEYTYIEFINDFKRI